MISSAYQYYMSTYGHRQATRYDTHKRSELKKVYNAIVSSNKRSPIYKVDLSENRQKYLIDLKEHARFYRATLLEAIKNPDEGGAFSQKDVYSSDPEALDVSIAKTELNNVENIPEGELYQIRIEQLAASQVNTGDFIPSNRRDIPAGAYSFDLSVHSASYEFQFNIPFNATNLDVQQKLARLINQSGIGLQASVIQDENGSSSLELSSIQTGLSPYENTIFKLSDEEDSRNMKIIDFFGLNNISQPPANAYLTANGREIISPTNSLTLDRTYSLTLKKTTDSTPVSIGLKRSAETIIRNVNAIVSGYNSIYNLASENLERPERGSERLIKDLNYLTNRFQPALDNSGIKVLEDGHLQTDEALIVQSFEDGSLEEHSEEILHFKNALLRQLNQVSIDPIGYLNKKMIAYPNPLRAYANPYQVSEYSGIMFSGYV